MTAFPRFVGLTPSLAVELIDMANRNGWDPEAIAAVIENESAWNPQAGLSVWRPNRTATGLLQFIEGTAQQLASRLGESPNVQWLSRDWVGRMTASEQLRLVEAFYQWMLGGRTDVRPVDFYAAGWGRGVGSALSRVLADSNSNAEYQPGLTHAEVYAQNRGLDLDGDGLITMADLQHHVERRIERARARGFMTLPRTPIRPLPRSGGGAKPFIFALSALGLAYAVSQARLDRK